MRILTLLIALFLIPTAFALEDCMTIDPMLAKDVPCNILGTFKYSGVCNDHTIKIYNSVPQLIGEHIMTDFTGIGGTDRCNVTFNFTTVDSYTFNISPAGDSGRLSVEREDNMLAIVIMSVILIVFFSGVGVLNAKTPYLKGFSLRLFGYGMAVIQLLTLSFMVYANEAGNSLASTLKINYTVLGWIAFGFGMIALIKFTGKMINPSSDEDSDEESKTW